MSNSWYNNFEGKIKNVFSSLVIKKEKLFECKTNHCKNLSKKISKFLKIIINLSTILVILISLVFIGLIFYHNFNSSGITIEPFSVPEDIKKKGYTGEAISKMLIDKIMKIKNNVPKNLKDYFSMENQEKLSVKNSVPTFEIEHVKVSLSSFLSSFMDIIGVSKDTFSGELVMVDDKISITSRISGKEGFKSRICKLEELDELLEEAAEHYLKLSNPLLLAVYQYKSDKDIKKAEGLKKAEKILKDYIKNNKKNANVAKAYHLWGLILYWKSKKTKKAEEMFRKAIAVNPKYDKVYSSLGFLLNRNDKIDEAIRIYEKAKDINPTAKTYNSLGLLYKKKGKIYKAEEMYKKAIEINIEFDSAYNNLGVLYKENDEIGKTIEMYEKAKEMYEKAIEINPKHAIAYNNLCALKITKNEYEKALNLAYDAYLVSKLNKDKAVALYQKSIAEKMLNKDTKDTEKELDEILKKKFTIRWSFEEIEKWLNDQKGKIGKENINFIFKLTEKLKKKIK